MQIEVVEFYPARKEQKKDFLRGTLHVYIIDFCMDIRGIVVQKNRDKWYFYLPSKFAKDPETNKDVQYPVINFTQAGMNVELFGLIKQHGQEYIERNFN